MTLERLQTLKKQTAIYQRQAERIMNGDSEYDGADGARTVLELCDNLLEVIADLEPHCTPLPPVAGVQTPQKSP